MIFRIAAGGELTAGSNVICQTDELIRLIRACLDTKGTESDMQLQWLMNPSFTGAGWRQKALADHMPIHAFCLRQEADWSSAEGSLVKVDSIFRGLASDWLLSQADLLLLVWNEDVTERSGTTWELMQQAYQKKIPCIWISSRTGSIYWLGNGYYEDFYPEFLKTLCQNLTLCDTDTEPERTKPMPFLALGNRLQQRFLGKYDAKIEAQPADRDRLLQEEYAFGEGDDGSRKIRQKLLEEFGRYDRKAIELGGKYRAIMYWRAILPLIASLFLAIGFYAETLLGIFPFPGTLNPEPWAILAAFGFLIHGMLNLYAYFLSKDRLVQSWHKGYIDTRNIAETYRVLLHFLPYGISLDLRKLCGWRRNIYAPVRRITTELPPTSFTLNTVKAAEILKHVEEMLEDQLSYQRGSATRYQRISDRLEQWNKCLFTIGFVVVILRGFFQFFIAYYPLSGTVNGISLYSYVRSFANMAALLLPAWASYFASKLNQCNYRYHARNHQEMEQAIAKQLKRVQKLQSATSSIPLEVLGTLAEEIAELILVNDTGKWYSKVGSSTITLL